VGNGNYKEPNDRVRGDPYDTHTAVMHPLASGRIYSAAGDGYFESTDAGDSWRSPEDGLKHHYLVGVAVDAADPDTVIVSATDGPGSAYWPRLAKTYVYRKTGLKRWELAMSGLPEAKGTTAARFATHAGEPGVIYAANNHGLFRSDNAGLSWKALDLLGLSLANWYFDRQPTRMTNVTLHRKLATGTIRQRQVVALATLQKTNA
jgi:hypothetical protein